MPFTPFHLGPALGLGLPLRRYLHVPTFLVASIIVDVEPLLVLVLGLSYPLHGYLHTFLFASLTGLALGYVMFSLDKLLNPVYRALRLVAEDSQGRKAFMVTGVLGAAFHVMLDSPLYRDIRPLFPFTQNPFYTPNLSLEVYSFCVWMGIIGIIYYVGLFVNPILKRQPSS
ncbi:hydrolase [archaeon]|nr:hydrolase [archaeon]